MKNVIIMLAVVAMAAPLFAQDVTFTEGDCSGGSLVLNYTCADPGVTPRGIGLKCEVLAGDTVDVDSDAVVADPCFNTFIDYAFMDPCNFAIGDGHPMADPCGAGVLDPSTGVDVFSICMGALDQTGNQLAGPGASSPLVSIPLASTAGSVTIRISEDDLRGGVVGSALSTNLPIDVVVSFGPACWNYPCFYWGDADGDNLVTSVDVQILSAAWSGAYNPCADFDKDGLITSVDVQRIIDGWNNGCP